MVSTARTWVIGSLLLALAVQVQAQAADGTLWRSVETCQKVVKKHVTLAESTISSTLQQLAESNSTMEALVRRWGSLVAATRPESRPLVDNCLATFHNKTETVGIRLEDALRKSLTDQVLWYDSEIFGLLTDALSEEGEAGIVQTVKSNLEPALQRFGSMAVSALKQAVKDLKKPYQTVAQCIRELELKYHPSI
ncbi:Ras association domain-containing protein 3 [Frankliniella fusca]|uniref:Ras association domain-containing protein 3 n=1 Tax=Frankliniella fusca TaxID=407009 RepID=A0AAE1LE94_9NEOP|nr:Ras association domain-containing protein 3 [Frankliniella fusca]